MKGNKIQLPENSPVIGRVYKHYKGDLYKVTAIALHSNDDVWMIVYEPMYENPDAPLFTRPLSEWGEIVDLNGEKVERFKLQMWDCR